MTPDTPTPANPLADVQLVTAADVCRVLSVSRTTLWRMIDDGRFPQANRLNGCNRLYWPAKTVRRWIRENSTPA